MLEAIELGLDAILPAAEKPSGTLKVTMPSRFLSLAESTLQTSIPPSYVIILLESASPASANSAESWSQISNPSC